MNTYTNFSFLQLFAEGAEGAGESGVNGMDAASQSGVNTPAAGETKTEGQAVDRKAEFQKLITGEYKDLYDAEVNGIVQNRLKRSKEVTDKYNTLYPALEIIAEGYGIDPGNTAALVKAITDDNSHYEKEAMKLGMPVENYKRIKTIERENERYRRNEAERLRAERNAEIQNGWKAQADSLKSIYPLLDFDTEIQNPQFAQLLAAGVDVRAAYEVTHRDQIIPAAMQFAQQNATDKIAASIAAGQSRPAEGGMQNTPSAQTKIDISKLSKKELDEYAARALRGERITFSS